MMLDDFDDCNNSRLDLAVVVAAWIAVAIAVWAVVEGLR